MNGNQPYCGDTSTKRSAPEYMAIIIYMARNGQGLGMSEQTPRLA